MSTQFGYSVEFENGVVIDRYKTPLKPVAQGVNASMKLKSKSWNGQSEAWNNPCHNKQI